MAMCSLLAALSPYAVPKLSSKLNLGKRRLSTRLNAAGFAEIEPHLREDHHDRWETNNISMDDFKFGEYDEHHTYHEGSFWGSIAEDIEAVGTPTGFQANEHYLFWLFRQVLYHGFFFPAIAAGMYFNAPGEYLYIGAGLFTIVFCIIEMDKPDKPHNFEPQIYNMERGARDKLIADYNTMHIWDFNEKYMEICGISL
ncbi:hypothetical protein D8674_010006 [Pyrus ussuriensis x Pyrus communis]|uniref:Photosynthetic NDH subunit of subcomplex B 5 n=1 Tax=Pyrus ussuriensis x Pyrus communis TaxID=2448454 RepID=A0A5N5F9K8_9ROSA|nr:hypothetical protein D8674_010006 [Pyrus ussuriensis x Pyrus communis]